jgi:hypothetical protein
LVGVGRDHLVLTAGGAAAFWVTNLAISLTPVAADYRAALSISYLPMLVEALVAGVVIAWCVTFALLRFPRGLPGRTPVMKALVVSSLLLVAVTLLVEVPAKLATATENPWRYLLVGLAIDVLRFSALAVAVGLLQARTQRRGPPNTAHAP